MSGLSMTHYVAGDPARRARGGVRQDGGGGGAGPAHADDAAAARGQGRGALPRPRPHPGVEPRAAEVTVIAFSEFPCLCINCGPRSSC